MLASKLISNIKKNYEELRRQAEEKKRVEMLVKYEIERLLSERPELTKPMILSSDLAEIVGKNEASRAECIKQIWAYIKENNLQDPEDKSDKYFFIPDEKMSKIFGTEKVGALGMAKFLSAHLSEVDNQDVDDVEDDYEDHGEDNDESDEAYLSEVDNQDVDDVEYDYTFYLIWWYSKL